MALTPLPTPPTTSDPANFATRADALVLALANMVTEINAGGAQTSTLHTGRVPRAQSDGGPLTDDANSPTCDASGNVAVHGLITANGGLTVASGQALTLTGATIAGPLVLNSSGNFGVGATPSTISTGKGFEIGFPGNGVWGEAADSVRLMENTYYNSGFKFGGTGYAGFFSISAGAHNWYSSTASGTAGNAATMQALMQLSAAGALTLNKMTAATFVAGDKYLVIDASGNVHVSAVGPAS